MSKIVSIHSFRGGTGKSNLIANVAANLAIQGRRVGIVDTDIQSPGIHAIFHLDEAKIERTLNDYLWGNCVIEEAAYDVSAALHTAGYTANNIFLIPSSVKVVEITRVLSRGFDVSTLTDGFYDLIRHLNLDYLLIDTHPGLNEETLLSIAISDALILLLRPDQQDYQGTAVTVDVSRELGVPNTFLVLNKVLPDTNMVALRELVETAYGIPVADMLPLSLDVVRNGSSDLFSLRHPDDPYSVGVRNIVAQLEAV